MATSLRCRAVYRSAPAAAESAPPRAGCITIVTPASGRCRRHAWATCYVQRPVRFVTSATAAPQWARTATNMGSAHATVKQWECTTPARLIGTCAVVVLCMRRPADGGCHLCRGSGIPANSDNVSRHGRCGVCGAAHISSALCWQPQFQRNRQCHSRQMQLSGLRILIIACVSAGS